MIRCVCIPFYLLPLLVLLSACGAEPVYHPGSATAAEAAQRIETLELAAPEDSTAARTLLRAYAEFGNHHRSDDRTPEFLFRRALGLSRAGKARMAVMQWSDVYDGFPTYARRADCVFWVAFLSENELNDLERAEKAYLLLLEEHPNSRFTEAARDALIALP